MKKYKLCITCKEIDFKFRQGKRFCSDKCRMQFHYKKRKEILDAHKMQT